MNTTFTRFRYPALLLPVTLLLAGPQPQLPQAPQEQGSQYQGSSEEDTYQGEAPERYAMVRTVEGEVRILKGELDEALGRGTPIAEGDVVESRGRGVLQLGDGTRIAFGSATRFAVLALFTDLSGERQVLLRLDYGRLRVALGGQTQARFRVDTPSGTATCFGKGAFSIEAEHDRLVRLKTLSGRVSFANERDEARVNAGERLTVYNAQDTLNQVRSFNTFAGDEFDRWSDRAVLVQRGESWERVPAEIRNYADALDTTGQWVQSDEFGWVWQPRGVGEDWRPYYRGRWAPYSGGMTWISDEPWAYVVYHHGRWHWGAGVGWFWIPGVNYSPAWVAWNHTPGYYGWAPLGFHNTPCHWGYGAWGGGFAWNVVALDHINLFNVHLHMRSDTHVLRTFGGGPGGAPWTGGGRDLRPPWQRSPLFVSHTEFRNPGQIQTAFRREVNRTRLGAYEHHAEAATGRVVIHRELRPPVPSEPRQGAPAVGPARTPFEDRRRTQPVERFAPKERIPETLPAERKGAQPAERFAPKERTPEGRPLERNWDPVPERKAEGSPRERTPEPKLRMEERRVVPSPKERVVEPAPRVERRRAEPTQGESGSELRKERRSEGTPTPREPRSEAQPRVEREVRRPDTPSRQVEREARPAPKAEVVKEVTKERSKEHPKDERH